MSFADGRGRDGLSKKSLPVVRVRVISLGSLG